MIIPLILTVIAIFFRGDFQHYFLNFDPAYAYLFNGANLARFTMDLGHTDHPGTPLQLLIAVVVRIGYWISGTGDLSEDFINRSEFYLTTVSNVIIFLIVGAVYLSGKHIYKATNLWTGIFFQLTCLGSLAMMRKTPGVLTEPVLGLISIGLLAVLLIHSFKPYYFKSENRFIIYLSLFIAIGSATKITFVIMAIAPFLYLDSIKKKLKYIGYTMLFFVLSIIPLIPNFSNFYEWIIRLFTHTDRYGKGEEGFVDVDSFFTNLGRTFNEDNVLTSGFGLALLVIFAGFLGIRKIDIKSKAFRLLISIMTASVLMILLVAKHYSFHYLLPVQMCMVTIWMLVIVLWFGSDESIFKKTAGILCTAIVLCLLLYRTLYFYIYSPDRYAVSSSSLVEAVTFDNDIPRIIGAANFHNHCALPEMALRFGLVYSGAPGPMYSRILKEKYPDTYYFNPHKGTPDHWLTFIGLEELWKKSKAYYLLSWVDDQVPLKQIQASLKSLAGNEFEYSIEPIFENEWTKEIFYRIDHNIPADSIPSYEHLFSCGFETKAEEFFVCQDSIKLQSAKLQTTELVRSGEYAVELKEKNNYALETMINVKAGELYKCNVWIHGEDNLSIIATNEDPQKLYKGSANVVGQDDEGWKHISLVLKIPAKMHNESMKLYCYKPGKGIVYLDDFEVLKIPATKN